MPLTDTELKFIEVLECLNQTGHFRDSDIGAALIERMACPIRLDGIRGNQPATIALSLTVQRMLERPWTRPSWNQSNLPNKS